MASNVTDIGKAGAGAEPVSVRQIDDAQILSWLQSGWRDFMSAPGLSLLYGLLFSSACLLTLYLGRHSPGFLLAFMGGLMLLGPVLAVGVCAASRQIAAGAPVSILSSLQLMVSRLGNLSIFALLLLLVMLLWMRLSALLISMHFTGIEQTVEAYVQALFSSQQGVSVMLYFMLTGFILALLVFIISVISIPLILDRNLGPFSAIRYSASGVWRNRSSMMLWAMLIVMLSGLGMVTGFLAMIVIFPLLGYASWHSYEALIGALPADEVHVRPDN